MCFIAKHFVLTGNINSIAIFIFIFGFSRYVVENFDFENHPETGVSCPSETTSEFHLLVLSYVTTARSTCFHVHVHSMVHTKKKKAFFSSWCLRTQRAPCEVTEEKASRLSCAIKLSWRLCSWSKSSGAQLTNLHVASHTERRVFG